jgi:hypothetical protein
VTENDRAEHQLLQAIRESQCRAYGGGVGMGQPDADRSPGTLAEATLFDGLAVARQASGEGVLNQLRE